MSQLGDRSKTVVKVENVKQHPAKALVVWGQDLAGVFLSGSILTRLRMNQGAWMILAVRDQWLVARIRFPGDWRQ